MKRRKSRNLLFMCVILLMAALAAGCGSKEDDGKGDVIAEETTAKSDSAKETTAAGTTAAKADSKKKTTAKADSGEETTAAKSKSGKKSILSSDSKKDTSSKKAAAETAEAKEEPIINSEDFYGCWEYATEDIWFYIYGDGTYEVFYSDGTGFTGEYYMDGADLCTDFDLNYTFDEDGALVDSDGDELFPSTLPDFTPTAYVKANDIDINYTLGQGDVSLADGAYYYEMGSEGRYYGTAPLTCSVYQDSSEDLGNGSIEKKNTKYL